MKKSICILILVCTVFVLTGCNAEHTVDVVATTRPVYDFTTALCSGTDIAVELLVTESISCLHDYTLQVRQMRVVESAQTVVISGAGLESFLDDVFKSTQNIIDASLNIALSCSGHQHEENNGDHHHEEDPHIWLSVDNARIMAQNICDGLIRQFPESSSTLLSNLSELNRRFDALDAYGAAQLSELSNRDMITFHDGFSYFAEYWDLHILHALEEESGSEASANELRELIELVQEYQIPAIFTEENGSTSASRVVATETGISVFALNMGMSDKDYFETMYHNIDTVKEALG